MAVDTLAAEAEAPPPRQPPRRLDRRTIIICVIVALVVAAISGGIVAGITDHDNSNDSGQPGLAQASSVPSDITFTRFDGTTGTLADYHGQKLVVNFFSSTCVPCRTEMPALEKVQQEAGDQITVVGIAVEDETSAAKAFVKKTGVHYDTGQDLTGELFAHVGGTVLPYTIFVAADGTIMERHSGALTIAELHKKISANLLAGG
jgi:thiol-disulfide isomerase/thioredoxin